MPLAVTIDGTTLEDNTVTIRFRDTRKQIRAPISELKDKIKEIMNNWGA